MKKVYISCYSNEHQKYKKTLMDYGKNKKLFFTNDANEDDFAYLRVDNIEELVKYVKFRILKDSDIAIFLIGKDSSTRRTIDWEIRAAMSGYGMLKKCGIIVVYLPEITNEFDTKIPKSLIPKILYENILNPKCNIIETTWNRINKESGHLEKLLNLALFYKNVSKYKIDKNIKIKNSTKYNIYQ